MPLGDEAQITLFDREHRCRSRPSIDDTKFAGNRTWTEDGQNSLLSSRRGYDDFEQTMLEPIAAITWITSMKQRLTGRYMAGCRVPEQSR